MSIEQENNDMLRSQIKEVAHHSKEIKEVVNKRTRVEPWVVAKMERASSDLSDITHYLDGERYAEGGEIAERFKNAKDETFYYVDYAIYNEGVHRKFFETESEAIKFFDEIILHPFSDSVTIRRESYNSYGALTESKKLKESYTAPWGKFKRFAQGGSMYAGGGSTYQIQIENKTDDDNYQIELEKIKLINERVDFDLVKGSIDEDEFWLSFYRNGNRRFYIVGKWHDSYTHWGKFYPAQMGAEIVEDSRGAEIGFEWHPFDSMGGFDKEQFIKNLNNAFKEINLQIKASEEIDEEKRLGIYKNGGSMYASGGEVSFTDYKGESIMFEPHFNEYYVGDAGPFSTMDEAKSYIDGGLQMPGSIKGAYERGLFARGGKVGIGMMAWRGREAYNVVGYDDSMDRWVFQSTTSGMQYLPKDEELKEFEFIKPKKMMHGGEIKVGDQFLNTERGEKFYIEKVDNSDKSFPFYVLKSKPTDFPEVIGKNEFERYYKAGLYEKMATGGSMYAGGGWVLYDQDTERKLGEYETESEAREMMYEYPGNANIVEKSVWDSSSTSMMTKGGNITKEEYLQLLSKYDKLGAFLEDADTESERKRLKSEMDQVESKIHSFERNKMATGGGVSTPENDEENFRIDKKLLTEDFNEIKRLFKDVYLNQIQNKIEIFGGQIFYSPNSHYQYSQSKGYFETKEIAEAFKNLRKINYVYSIKKTEIEEEEPENETEVTEILFILTPIRLSKTINKEKFKTGGGVSSENAEKIAKLEKVLTSTLVPDAVKEKARLEIERLKSETSEPASGLSAEQRDLNKKTLALVDKNKINDFDALVTEALTDANYHSESFKFAMLVDSSIKTKEDWYQAERFSGDDKTRDTGIAIANMCGWDGDKITEALYFVLKMKGEHKLADALKKAMEVENQYPNRIESTTETQNFFIKEIATRTATDQRAVTEFVKNNGLTESQTLNIVQGLGMGKLKPMDFVTALVGNPGNEYEQQVIAFAKSNEAFKTPEQKPAQSIRTAVVEVEKEQPKVSDDRLKGKQISEVSKYVPHRNIESITFTIDGKSYTVKGSDIFDGVYVENSAIGIKAKRTTKAKQPKVARTQFEEEEFEFGSGGYTRPSGKVSGIYEFAVKDGITELKVVGFERQNDTQESLYFDDSEKAAKTKFGSILVKNNAMSKITKGNTVMATSTTGIKGKLTRIKDLF